ncbi:MAG: hypothetical protein ACPG49_11755, partial [Chitinophagales bacterium]
MKKLIQLLQSLSLRELHRFEEYLQSPIFNKSQKCLTLFRCLKKEAPDFDVREAQLLSQVFVNGTKLDLSVLCSKLLRLLEGFLIFLKQEKQTNYQKHLLFETLLERSQTKHFQFVWKKAIKDFDKQIVKREEDYHARYLWEFDYYRHQLQYRTKHQKIDIQPLLDAFEVNQGIGKLRHINTAKQLYNSTNQLIEVFLEDDFLQSLQNQSWSKNPLLELHYSIYHLLNRGNESDFELLKTNLKKSSSSI